MEFIQHTIGWTKGEIFESALIGLAGVAVIVVGLAFWIFGETPGAKASPVPLLLLGLLMAAVGTSGYFTNQKRIPRFEQAYAENPGAFVRAEKARVEGFQYLYGITLVLAPACFAVASFFFWFSTNPHLRAVGIALVLLGLSALLVDFFSKERADVYYGRIQSELRSPGG